MRPLFAVLVCASFALAEPPTLTLKPSGPSGAGALTTVTAETDAKSVRLKVVGDAQHFVDTSGRIVAVVPKSGRVSVIGVAASETGELSEIVELVLLEGNPNPGPAPGPGPQPPVPVEPSKLFIVVIEETSAAAATRGALFANEVLAKRVKDKGHRWRIVDKDVTDSTGKPPADLVRFLEKSDGKPKPQVFLVDENGKTRYQGDLPTNAKDLTKLLEQHGG